MHITVRMAFTGFPSPLHLPNHCGIISSSAIARIRRLTAIYVAKSAVSWPDSMEPPITATPNGPSAFFAAEKTGIPAIPVSPGSALLYSFQFE